jgi:VCBS repeat-containing protein
VSKSKQLRAFLCALTMAACVHVLQMTLGAQAAPLRFFQNYFVTGDYVVGGVGLAGRGGVADIPVSGVPSGADILAAFLYWQVVADATAPTAGSVAATFKGNPLGSPEGPFAASLGTGVYACPLSGGTSSKRTFSYRADVLRYFDVDASTGKQAVNGAHRITVPDTGVVKPLGASLVVVYRDPDPAAPLKSVVIHDGEYSMNASSEGFVQPITGFYDGTPGPARLTAIVGSAQALLSERLRFNGSLLATNAFRSSAGNQWDNPTFTVATPAPGASGVTSEVTVSGDYSGILLLKDCLSLAAMVYSTAVEDTDGDGLLDVWEESTTPLTDPDGVALPHLAAMGASPTQRDIFVEIGAMHTPVPTQYGPDLKGPHTHMPGHASLKLIGDAFDRQGIRVHFDVGNDYPAGDADPYLIRGDGLARGGETIDESVTVCARLPGDPPWVCQFSNYPGTVGWKAGYRFLRDEVLVQPPLNPDGSDPCDLRGNTCERRFDSNRQDLFHYALFAHHLGLPKSEFPCLASGVPVPGDANGACTVAGQIENPEFFDPKTNTGIADFPGADILVSLGGFQDVDGLPVGTPFMQAATLMHELGHNFERRHGGEAFEPNCKPTYLSVMNYLYQLRGLLDDAGRPHLDFSGTVGATVDEANLNGAVASPYRLGWYAPLATSYLAGRTTAAQRHCNGSPLAPGELEMVRIDARYAADAVDWDADADVDSSATAQDVNYSGAVEVLAGSDDWSNIRLNQFGARRNIGAVFTVPGTLLLEVGPLSIGMGKGDLGKGDLGKGDLGKGDLGKGDLGKGDLGKGDLGKGDLGKGDLGKGDLGGGDLFLGDPSNPEGGEIDATTAGDLANTPPNEFDACVVGTEGCPDAPGPDDGSLHDVRATFGPPTVGGVASFTLYRVAGAELLPGQEWAEVATLTSLEGAEQYTAIDRGTLVNGAQYTFFVRATYTDGTLSDVSNVMTVTAVNDPPVAGPDAYASDEDTPLSVAGPGVLGNDDDPDSETTLTASLVTGPQHAASFALNADGSFSYAPAPNFNGVDTFTYVADSDGVASNTATVTITVNAVNDPPVAGNDAYGATEDTALTVGAPGVLGNDDDVESDATLSAVLVSGPPVGQGSVALSPDGSFVFTPAAHFNGSTAFTYQAVDDDAGVSNTATVTITVAAVNDPPAISDIADVTIYANSNTGPLSFTIGDVEGLAGLAVSGSSSNTTLVPTANIVFGGSGAARTVTVTPAAGKTGTATITVTVTDGGGLTAIDTFVVSVQPSYTFKAVKNLPPPRTSAGSTIPLQWAYKDGLSFVDSADAMPVVEVVGPCPATGPCTGAPVRTFRNTDPGSSGFSYSGCIWSFNLQTKSNGVPYPKGTYQLTIKADGAGFPSSPTYTLVLR